MRTIFFLLEQSTPNSSGALRGDLPWRRLSMSESRLRQTHTLEHLKKLSFEEEKRTAKEMDDRYRMNRHGDEI
jgi:hypothetical protein